MGLLSNKSNTFELKITIAYQIPPRVNSHGMVGEAERWNHNVNTA